MKNLFTAKKLTVLLLSLFSAAVFIAALTGILSTRESKAESVMDGEIEAEYFIGEQVVIPSAKLVIDGAEISATPSVVFPNGTVVVADSVTPDAAGKYSVKYQVKKDGKLYYDVKTFNVYKPLFQVTGNGSAVYGTEEKFGNAQGVKVSISDGAVFRLNRKVNLEELEDEIPFLTLRIDPERTGYAELDNIYIKITDAQDPNSFFALKITYMHTRVTAATTAHLFGYINNFTTLYSDSIVCPPQQGSWSGQMVACSFVGNTEKGDIKDQKISFYYNTIKHNVTATDVTGNVYSVLSLGSFPDEWQGLTDGNVYVEIFGGNFRSTFAHLFIDGIGTVDLDTDKYADENAPVITVNYNGADENGLPVGYAGCSYPVFGATAKDEEQGETPVSVAVYYNYYSETKISVPVTDGRFYPNRAGTYTVEYVSSDDFANISRVLADITVESAENAAEFTCSAGEHLTECKVGDNVTLPNVVWNGYVYDYSVKTQIIKDGKSYYPDENGAITVMESGEYEIGITATDFLGRTCAFTYTLTASPNPFPIFTVDPEEVVSDKFIVGYRQKLPEITAVAVNGNNVSESVSVAVSVTNGSVTDGYYVPSSSGDVTLTFSATANGNVTEKTLTRKAYSIKNENGIDFKSIFISNGDNVESVYSESGFAEYRITGDGKIEYLNTVLSENASVKLQTDGEYKSIKELLVRFVDINDRSVKVETRLKSFDGAVFASVNGEGFRTVVGGDFSGENALEIKYVNSLKTVSVNGVGYFAGENFNGLNSAYARLEIEVIGESENSVYGLIVEKVGNQSLKNDTTVDVGKPMIACVGDYGGNYPLGGKYLTPEITAKDMVDPELKSFIMSVQNPDGSFAVVNGVELNGVDVRRVEIELTEYGTYSFVYQATDFSNRKEKFVYVINVLDTVAPTVTTQGTYAVTSETGKPIAVANFVATDNVDSADKLTVRILVLDTDLNFTVVTNRFTPTKAGKYTVYCYVTDTFGNVGLCYYTVEVK